MNSRPQFLKSVTVAIVMTIAFVTRGQVGVIDAPIIRSAAVNNDITNGILAWYLLNEGSGTTANDNSGNGHTGTLTNSPTWHVGYLSFDSTVKAAGIAVGIPDATGLTFTNGNDGSISFWVKPNPTRTGYYETIIGKRSSLANYVIELNPSAMLEFYNGSLKTTSQLLSTNAWTFVVFEISGTSAAFYTNGNNLVMSFASTGWGPPTTSTGPLTFGFFNDGTGQQFNGAVDDIRLWNRTLAGSEMTTLFNNGAK